MIKKKSGQFYLIAAIVVSGLVIGYLSVTNFVVTKEANKADFIFEELKIESGYILDYAIAKNNDEIIKEFSKNYSKNVGSDVKIYYFTGEEDSIDVYTFNAQNNQEENVQYTELDNEVKIEVNSKEQIIETNLGKNFHYLIVYEKDGQDFIKKY